MSRVEASKEIFSRFPIEQVFFIAAFGFFVVVSFPFDIFKFFSNGFPKIHPSSIFQDIGSYVKTDFAPFANVQYLGKDFPSGFIETFLLSLAFGIVAFFLHDYLNKVNHIPKWLYYQIARKPEKQPPSRPIVKQLAFARWIRKEGYGKLLDFFYSMQLIATGLLWGAEVFLALVFLSWVTMGFGGAWDQWWWMVLPAAILLLLFAIYKACMKRLVGFDRYLLGAFEESRPIDEFLRGLKDLLDRRIITQEEYERERNIKLKEFEREVATSGQSTN